MKQLKDDIKSMEYKNVYLLYGEERYLVDFYAKTFSEKLLDAESELMNKDIFYGKDIPAETIIGAAETLPFLCEKRLSYVHDSSLFASGRKDDSDIMAEYIPRIPETTVLIFVESNVDKRSRLYKKVASLGRAVECLPPDEDDLIKWVGNVFKKKGKTISASNASYLIKTTMQDMNGLYNEIEKLIAYSGKKDIIEAADIDEVCTPSLESKVFDMTDAVSTGDTSKALQLYRNMVYLKESPVMILTILYRHFRRMLLCKEMDSKHISPYDMAQQLGIKRFAADIAVKQGKRFTFDLLLHAITDCQDMDMRFKSGKIDVEIALEMLIVTISKTSQ